MVILGSNANSEKYNAVGQAFTVAISSSQGGLHAPINSFNFAIRSGIVGTCTDMMDSKKLFLNFPSTHFETENLCRWQGSGRTESIQQERKALATVAAEISDKGAASKYLE